MGIETAVAPREIFRRKTPREVGRCASSASVLPSTALFDVHVDALDGHVQQLRVVDLLRARPGESHEDLARTHEREHVALP